MELKKGIPTVQEMLCGLLPDYEIRIYDNIIDTTGEKTSFSLYRIFSPSSSHLFRISNSMLYSREEAERMAKAVLSVRSGA